MAPHALFLLQGFAQDGQPMIPANVLANYQVRKKISNGTELKVMFSNPFEYEHIKQIGLYLNQAIFLSTFLKAS